MAHWVEVKNSMWVMCSEVTGFQAVLGAHDGQNLGHYLVGMFDQIGIMGPKQSKVNKSIDIWSSILIDW